MIEDQVIFKYPDKKFVGLATRRPDKTLNHVAFILVNSVPQVGDPIENRKVVELIRDEKLLKELSTRARVDKIEAVAVLGTPTKTSTE